MSVYHPFSTHDFSGYWSNAGIVPILSLGGLTPLSSFEMVSVDVPFMLVLKGTTIDVGIVLVVVDVLPFCPMA